MVTANKTIPAGVGAPDGDQNTKNQVGQRVPQSIAQDTDIPLLNDMNPRGQRIAAAYYESGVLAGIEMGRAQAEAEQAELDRAAAASVRVAANGTDYATLCERRNEPKRAARQREVLIGRGIIPPIMCSACGTPTSPWTCSCGQARQMGVAA